MRISAVLATVWCILLLAVAPAQAAPPVALRQRITAGASFVRERWTTGTRTVGGLARSTRQSIRSSAPARMLASWREVRSLDRQLARTPSPSPELAAKRARAHADLKTARSEAAADLKQLGRGVAQSPLHLVEHLRDPKQLALAIGVTGGVGVLTHLAGIDFAPIAEVVLPAVVVYRWYRALRGPIREAHGPDRWREVGRESGSAVMLGLELLGVDALAHEHVHEIAHHAAAGVSGLARAFAAGVVGLHDLFLLPTERAHHHRHDHAHAD